MPYDIFLDQPPAGYALGSSKGAGGKIPVQFIEFTSSEDGQHFIQRLEGWPNILLRQVGADRYISPSQVDHMLAIIRRDNTATVYLNELPIKARIRVSRAIEAGVPVYKDDVVDIEEMDPGGVEIPSDAGVVFVFSVGWRKGLFYDLGPLGSDEPVIRAYDINSLLGQCYTHLLFQERFNILESEWDALFKAQWFPFAALKSDTLKSTLNYIRSGWNPDDLTDQIVNEVKEKIDSMLESWKTHSAFLPHADILEKSVKHFKDGDFLSCSGLLYPRIEGILRTYRALQDDSTTDFKQSELSKSAVTARIGREKCLLLPHKFEYYLKNVYFASFDPKDHDHPITRHTVSHGVVGPSKFDAKAAVIGILIVHQLYYCFEPNIGRNNIPEE